MVSSIRHTTIPVTAGLYASGNPALLCNSGQDYAVEYIDHVFSAGEIGTNAGQTMDSTNPGKGFLFAQFQGSKIKAVIALAVRKTVVAGGGVAFRSFAWATAAPAYYNVSTRIVNSDPSDALFPGYDPNYSSIYLFDTGSGATAQIAIGDTVFMVVALGNS